MTRKFVGCAMLAIGVSAFAIEARAQDWVYIPEPSANGVSSKGNCPEGKVVTYMGCGGYSCANTWLYCETPRNWYSGETLSVVGASSQTPFTNGYSFLNDPNRAVCPTGSVMTGFVSSGLYSFNIAAICRQLVVPSGYRYYFSTPGYRDNHTVSSDANGGDETIYEGDTRFHNGVRCQTSHCEIIHPHVGHVTRVYY